LYPTAVGPSSGLASTGTAYFKSFTAYGPDTTRDISWELRLASDPQKAFRWMLGASYYTHYLTRTTRFGVDKTGYTGAGIPWSVYVRFYNAFFPITGDLAAFPNLAKNNIRDKANAAYLSLDYNVTDKLSIGGDLRYDEVKRQLNNNLIVAQQNRKDTYYTYRVNADYKIDPSKMVYVSVAKGVLDGFFNGTVDAAAGGLPVPLELQNYKPSTNITYEIGGKMSWLNNRLTTNLAVFYIDYKDLQITAAPPPPLITALTTNAAAATVQGFELSVDARVTEHFSAGIGYAYTDPKYSNGAIDLSNIRYCGIGVPAICTTNVAGNQLTRSSKNTVNAYLEWTWYARLDGRNQSKQYPRSVSIETYPGYTLGNARVGFLKSDKLGIDLWVKNIADKVYIVTGITQPNSNPTPVMPGGSNDFIPNVFMGERRTYGLTVSYKF
jgi:outer membrane receptor protein involved in Fe transport